MSDDLAYIFPKYILCFAYIDGKFEDEVAERLDEILGMNFMMNGEYDMESFEKKKVDMLDMETWKEQVKKIKAEKERVKKECLERIENNNEREREKLVFSEEAEKKSILQMKEKNEEILNGYQLMMQSTGKMHFLKRNSLKKFIKQSEAYDEECNRNIKLNRDKLEKELKNLDEKTEEEKKSALQEIENKYPIPKSPDEIRNIISEYSSRSGEIQLEILRMFVKRGRVVRVEEMMEEWPKLSSYSRTGVGAATFRLHKAGFLDSDTFKEKNYYELVDEKRAKEVLEIMDTYR